MPAGMALHPALQVRHVVEHVLLDIVALPARLTNMEELLQVALVLVARYVLQELMQPLEQQRVHHVLLDTILLQEQAHVHCVQLDTFVMQHHKQYVRLEHILLQEQ
jgi:hypothetical protein